MNNEKLNEYFERFFEEKDSIKELFEVEDEEKIVHLIDKSMVLETIKNLDEGNKQIVYQKFTEIDFFNKDINAFIEYLLRGII